MENILYLVVPAVLLLGLLLWKRGGQIPARRGKTLP